MSNPNVTSNPNNRQNDVFYNGQAYTPKVKGGMSYIEVGNRHISVDLNDPTWFLTFAHGDYSMQQKWEKLDADLEEQKNDCKTWLTYYEGVKEKSSKAWSNFRNLWHDACENLYATTNLYKETKEKYDNLMASAEHSSTKELSIDERVDAERYEEEMNNYSEQQVAYSADKSLNKRKQIAAGAEFQDACRSTAREHQSIGRISMQQIVNKYVARA